jgi:uncharacterized membrane protein YbhN (UPF0104 family)
LLPAPPDVGGIADTPIKSGVSPAPPKLRWRFVIALVATLGLILAMFSLVRFDVLLTTLVGADLRLIGAALLLVGVIVATTAWRWRLMLAATGVSMSMADSVFAVLAASALNSVSPSKAGDLIKVRALDGRAPTALVLGGLLAERVIDVAVLGAIAAFAAFATRNWLVVAGGAALVVIGACVCAGLLLSRRLRLSERWRRRFIDLGAAARVLQRRPGLLVLLALVTLTTWCTMTVLTWTLYHAVGATVSVLEIAVALPIAVVAGLAPLTIAGAGTRDAALVLLMAGAAAPAQSVAVGLLYTALVYVAPALVGAPALLRILAHRPSAPA